MSVLRTSSSRAILFSIPAPCRLTSLRSLSSTRGLASRTGTSGTRSSLLDSMLDKATKGDERTKQLQKNDAVRLTDPEMHIANEQHILSLRAMIGPGSLTGETPEYHLHVYTHKHNTHITLTDPKRDAIISVSTGNLGFTKAGRGSYDAAFQLASFVLNKISTDEGLMKKIKNLHLIFRGFGKGRDAVTKAILGLEGVTVSKVITKVMDGTKIAQGGPRAKKPRRLG